MSNDDTPVTVPFWVLDQAAPTMLGALKIYQLRLTPAAHEIDLAKFERALEIILTEMERAVPGALS